MDNKTNTKLGEQKSTKELEEQAKNVETFNPYWHNGEFLGPNTNRKEKDIEKYEEDCKHS